MALQAAPGQGPDSSPGTNSPPDCSFPGSAYRIALGPRAGRKVLSLRTVAGREEKPRKALCPDAHGFSLHAAVRLASHQCEELERLSRTITRPALANERLSRNARGQVVLNLKSLTRDGTAHIVMQPQAFMRRLAALVPRPRLHLIRFHGVLAPNAKLRAAVIPQPEQKNSAPAHEHTHGVQAAPMRWARLLKRVFHIDVERCACCGQLKILAAIEEPVVIVRILTHLGL
ncbi:MAG: transposase, partial [Gemmatimonadaceae bacterium]